MEFSLTHGGPFFAVLNRLRIRTETSLARSWWLGLLVWLPLAIGTGVRLLLGWQVDPTLRDISVHVRPLFTLPILLLSERLLEQTSRSAMNSFYIGNFCDRAAVDRVAHQAERLRDAWLPEAVLLAVAFTGGQLSLWGVIGSGGLFDAGAEVTFWSVPRIWYAAVALPLVQFVMFRWMWRWLIWSYLLVRLSRLPVVPLATHADRAGGLAGLARPMTAFAGFTLANAAVLSGAWGTKILTHQTIVQALLPYLVTFLLLTIAIALTPLLSFSGHLFRARRHTLTQYGDLMRDYTMRFHGKWILSDTGRDDLLGSPDIQSLNDLGQSYDVAQQTRIFIFGPRNVLTVWAAGVIPMVPLLASMLTFQQVLKRIMGTVIGGFPL